MGLIQTNGSFQTKNGSFTNNDHSKSKFYLKNDGRVSQTQPDDFMFRETIKGKTSFCATEYSKWLAIIC